MKSLGWWSVRNLSLQMGRDLRLSAEAVFIGVENVSRRCVSVEGPNLLSRQHQLG
jgi:hypothetical protein